MSSVCLVFLTSVCLYNNNIYKIKHCFNSCERLLLGTLVSYIDIEAEYLRSEHICLTLTNTKRGTDLGTQVILLEQTFHPLHRSTQ